MDSNQRYGFPYCLPLEPALEPLLAERLLLALAALYLTPECHLRGFRVRFRDKGVSPHQSRVLQRLEIRQVVQQLELEFPPAALFVVRKWIGEALFAPPAK